jgi:flagellar biosynthesis protein FliQ
MEAADFVADLVRDGLIGAVVWIVPLALAAVGAALAVGALLQRLGVAEPSVVLVARAVAVLAALALTSSTLATRAAELGRVSFSQLVPIGRGEPPAQ